jgi:succinate dehydrogenase/fumarate reductase cytochrome b subunit
MNCFKIFIRIRHLLWDLGLFLELSNVHTSEIIMLFCVACLNVLNIILFIISA